MSVVVSISWSPLKNRMPKNVRIANFGHPVSESWLRPCLKPGTEFVPRTGEMWSIPYHRARENLYDSQSSRLFGTLYICGPKNIFYTV